ncbi:hypothetical protein [Dietzia maris]|uniref:hypothetical protein n=1 Tax=Dietzia maris TaxID=37915 RepID=UPI0037C9B40B
MQRDQDIPADSPGHETEKMDAGVMAYLTRSERAEFKAWAFDQGKSMSTIIRDRIIAAMSGPQPIRGSDELESPSSQEYPDEAEQDQARQTLDGDFTAALAQMLWRALEEGSPLPALADEVGLPAEQIRQILTTRPHALPLAE